MPALLDYIQTAQGPPAPEPLASPGATAGYVVPPSGALPIPPADTPFSYWMLSRRSNQWSSPILFLDRL